jgi:2-polyprenyl-3-methyl-5-hydroxy-6-metoxy-1,4-benzoquinol methylase
MIADNTHAAGPGRETEPARRRLAQFATGHAVRRQRRVWSGRVATWDQHGSAGLAKVTAAVLGEADVQPDQLVVDLGCGTGQISLPLAAVGAQVLAVDVSSAMIRRLQAEAGRQGLRLDALALPIEELMLPPASVDLIISSYALHHLRDPDKQRIVTRACGWLRPGGRLLVADMMFGRGASARDRAIIRSKLGVLARRGPGGWWRIAKNTARFLLRVHERPVSLEGWVTMLTRAGFGNIAAREIVAEAGIVTGERPRS